jgi:hypothetical protein
VPGGEIPVSEANPLCPICGDLLDQDGYCFGENPDYPHAAAVWELDEVPQLEMPPPGADFPGLVTLDGDMIIKPWRYK